jgi:hypothetical protein
MSGSDKYEAAQMTTTSMNPMPSAPILSRLGLTVVATASATDTLA